MKAVLLAAGRGTRLRPITNSIPKCLVPIRDKPLLGYWLESLGAAGISSILVNLYHHAEKVEKFVSSRPERDSILLVHEPELRGTAGTLKDNYQHLSGEPCLVIHADNVCCPDLKSFIVAHKTRPSGTEITMMTFVSDDPSSCGIVEIDEAGVVHGFHEKVENPPGNIANAAIYIFEQSVIRYIFQSKDRELFDISKEVIPKYLGRIYTAPADGVVIDVGTLANLERAKSYARDLAG